MDDNPLHVALGANEQTDVVENLIHKRVDVNATDAAKNTPLHLAAKSATDNVDTAKLLIDAGADVNAVNADDYSVAFGR